MLTAAIDVGTNSTRLLVAKVEDGTVSPIFTALKTTRLGQGIMKKRLQDEAMSRTIIAIKEFVARSLEYGAEKIFIAATSAVREADNKNEFIGAVYSATGYRLRVLSGIEEAGLSYLGVVSGIENHAGATVIDIGGGSTEFIWQREGKPQFLSVNAGAVRMTEMGCGKAEVEEVLGQVIATIGKDCSGELIGVGGTVTSLAAMAQSLKVYDREKIHGFELTLDNIDKIYQNLIHLSVEERKQLPGLQPERADIIPSGALILREILRGLEKNKIIVSEADILYGLIIKGNDERCHKKM